MLSINLLLFMVRFAYRFDSELDQGAARTGQDSIAEGTKLVYRVEEYALKKLLPDLSVWALGEILGIGSDDPENCLNTRNWFFAQYAPALFTAEIRVGLEATYARSILYAKPNFSWNFFNKLLVPGIAVCIAQDYGDAKIYPGSPYSYIELKPRVQVNFSPGAYAAFSYFYRMEYKFSAIPPEQQTQWINLRPGITF